ncbi:MULTISPECIES: hypothetical protein [unclassified Flavobacterium]|uniref:hypothetical protein n=1 Tax=unclassified Flavobacterium TaxID=196869 RepID=UPI001F13FF4F|nr:MULTISPECIES: hypothetical protein [unclassified Flavobacterium]UMY66132.1 hypothetical protein MKO97_01770 [Flavobacterium sp. HJ-32-4]
MKTFAHHIVALAFGLTMPFTLQGQSSPLPKDLLKSEVPTIPDFLKAKDNVETHRRRLEEYVKASFNVPDAEVKLFDKSNYPDKGDYELTCELPDRTIDYWITGGRISEATDVYRFWSHDISYQVYTRTEFRYYEDGGICSEQSYGGYFDKEGFEAGIWRLFDKKGKIIFKLDFDHNFRMNEIEVVHQIREMFYFLEAESATIYRGFDPDHAYWVVLFPGCDSGDGKIKGVIVDDRTGQVIYENDKSALNAYLFEANQKKLVDDFVNRYYKLSNP